MSDLLLKNAVIVNSEPPFLLKKTWLAIKNGKINHFGQHSPPKIKKTFNLRGKIIIPGLINCHTHAAMVAFRGLADDLPLETWLKKYIWPQEKKKLCANFIKKWILLACQEMLAGGITCFADMYYFQKQAAQITSHQGIRFIAGDALVDFKKDCFPVIQDFIDTVCHPLVDFALMPHATYSVSKENLIKAKKLADCYQKPLMIHVAEDKAHQDDISYLDKLGILDKNTVLIHAIWLSKKDIAIIAQRQAKVVYCPQSNMKLASGIAPISQLLDAGVIVGLGTDGAASNNTLDMFGEMKTATLLQKVINLDPTVLPAKKVFQMATIAGAKVLGKEKEIGLIKVGKAADLVILDFDKPHLQPVYDYFSHLVYAARASDVVATLVAGKLVYKKPIDCQKDENLIEYEGR